MSAENDKILTDIIIKGFEESKTITSNLQAENKSTAIALNGFRKELDSINEDIDWLVKTVRDEGGDRSVMARLIMLENQNRAILGFFEQAKKDKEAKEKTLDNISAEEQKGKWQLRIALATGCLGFIATVITTILSFYFKK